MKKLLLSLLVGSMAFNGYAADYDTLYVGPNQDVRYEIKLNTTKYPELKDMTVSDVVWYLGDPHNRLTDKGNVAIQLAETDFKIEEENDKYYLEYRQANGTLSKKVCKISEKEYAANSITQIIRKQSFRPVTTRVFHPGLHQVSVILNGKEFEKYDFELVES